MNENILKLAECLYYIGIVGVFLTVIFAVLFFVAMFQSDNSYISFISSVPQFYLLIPFFSILSLISSAVILYFYYENL